MKAALVSLRAHEACSGKAGAVGYCLGGKLAYLMATRSDSDASASYYGVGLADLISEAGKIQKPLMLHVAAKDQFVPPDQQAKVAAALKGNRHVTLHTYEAQDHAFARIGGQHYDKAAADLANGRTLDFFREHLNP